MSTRDDQFGYVLAATGGLILATSPRQGWGAADGSWEIVRAIDPATRGRLTLAGMMGADRRDAERRGRASYRRGRPAGPDELAWAITEHGLVPAAGSSTWDAGAAVEWYVAACLAADDMAQGAEPEPDPLPVWVEDWLARLACPRKAAYARDAAHAVYWGWPDPAPLDPAPAWVDKVWAKLGRRHAAELTRHADAIERRNSPTTTTTTQQKVTTP